MAKDKKSISKSPAKPPAPRAKPTYSTKPNGKNDTGRPEKPLDLARITTLSKFMYSDAELASALGCSQTHFKAQKAANPLIQEAIDAGRGSFKCSLRRKQATMALKGDKTMLIWLGKQYLGQKDQVEYGYDPDRPPPPPAIINSYNFANAEEAAAAFKARLQQPG